MMEKLTGWVMRSFARVEELRSEDGQALVEYALILSLIAVVCIGALTLLGGNVNNVLNTIANAV
jgi:pilus assembly protein Flp/PilA